MKRYYVYILTSQYNGTLYIGVTSNLIKRIWEHKNKIVKGFTSKYGQDITLAIHREKRLKEWKREWKLNLIEQVKPPMV